MNKYINKKYLQLYLDYLSICGANVGDSQWMLENSDVFYNAKDTIPFSVIQGLKKEFYKITNEPMFPFYLGIYMGKNINTNIDYMLKFSSGIREAAYLSNKFYWVRSNVIAPIYKIFDDSLEIDFIKIQENVEFELPIMFASAALIYSFFRTSFGVDFGGVLTLNVIDAEPDYFSGISKEISYNIRFSQIRNYIKIDMAVLDKKNPNSDIRLKNLLMTSVIDTSNSVRQKETFKVKVRECLLQSPTLSLSADDVASKLYMSKRTLSRRLKEENLSFLSVLDEVRMELAQKCLDRGDSVTKVASDLGYESNASLVALFKRHSGKTPKSYREGL